MTDKTVRHDGRQVDELRQISIHPNFVRSAAGSALIEVGGTRVICTATVEDGVPRWLDGSKQGWLTAEYGMLPASTGERKRRPGVKPDGRSVEIQRLIGRSIRAVVDLTAMPELTVHIDCDVLEADGGTRCASITGAYVALALASSALKEQGRISRDICSDSIAAVSVGIVDGECVLDLDYVEDSSAHTDANVVICGSGGIVEFQATAERQVMSRNQIDQLLDLATLGTNHLAQMQRDVLAN